MAIGLLRGIGALSRLVGRAGSLSGGGKSVRIEVDGLEEFQRSLRRAANTNLPKEMGQVHKQIGELVISRLDPPPSPAAVGRGRGASVRPSASKRDVLLRVGGAHRAGNAPKMQWGKSPGRTPGVPAPERPYILRTAKRHEDDILDQYAKGIEAAVKGTFWKVDL